MFARRAAKAAAQAVSIFGGAAVVDLGRLGEFLDGKILVFFLYGDNVFEKCGINRDGAGEVGKPRYFNGKRHF